MRDACGAKRVYCRYKLQRRRIMAIHKLRYLLSSYIGE